MLSPISLSTDRVPSVCFFFFFSSRRRHTRSLCDWSSDVCSSDLYERTIEMGKDILMDIPGFMPVDWKCDKVKGTPTDRKSVV